MFKKFLGGFLHVKALWVLWYASMTEDSELISKLFNKIFWDAI